MAKTTESLEVRGPGGRKGTVQLERLTTDAGSERYNGSPCIFRRGRCLTCNRTIRAVDNGGCEKMGTKLVPLATRMADHKDRQSRAEAQAIANRITKQLEEKPPRTAERRGEKQASAGTEG